jgi:hypothetical protein
VPLSVDQAWAACPLQIGRMPAHIKDHKCGCMSCLQHVAVMCHWNLLDTDGSGKMIRPNECSRHCMMMAGMDG